MVFSLLVVGFACDKKTTTGNKTPTVGKTPVVAQTQNPNAPPGAQPPNMLGSPTATVTVEEFADFQCPTCANIHKVMKDVQAAYGSRIKFIFRNFPLTQIHKNAYEAATAAEAAGLQGKFWDMQNLLFTNQQAWSNSSDARTIFVSYAEKIGLDVEKFKTDLAGLEAKQRVDKDMDRGRGLAVSSTPTIYVNGFSVPYEQMTLDGLRQVIDAALQKAEANQQSQTAPANSSAPSNSASNDAKK